MQIVNRDNQLTIDLFHGTSTLFLDSINQNGLGAVNPITQWDVLELCKEVCALSEEHLQESQLYKVSFSSLKKMSEQSTDGSFNFQHGDTYLSPSKQTAARYAINKRYGSEILTYTINFLQELLLKNIPYIKKDLYRKYPVIFGFIEANPSPLLIQAKSINISSLLSEKGNNPLDNLYEINDVFVNNYTYYDTLVQQTNFRLTSPVSKNNLNFWLINVQKWSSLDPKYNLYKIDID